ncbi:hypothetical protein AX767_09870 [Variovorax sp. PAMC 28711]|nr:hypothetical protein AX767_09870 [Variovorax sp. PAMC 28711]
MHAAQADVFRASASGRLVPAGSDSFQRIGGGLLLDVSGGQGRRVTRTHDAGVQLTAVPGRSQVDAVAVSAAQSVGIDPHLVRAVAWAESGFRADAVSPKGAMGVMQLMPATARQYGVDDPFDAAKSLEGGSRLLRDLLLRYDGDVPLALAAYNAGPGAVERAGRNVPDYRETRAYVGRVMGAYEQLRSPSAAGPAFVGAPTTRVARTASSDARHFGNAWVFEVPAVPRRNPEAAVTAMSL